MLKIMCLISIATGLAAQDFEPEDFFPFHIGDIWEYSTDSGLERRELIRDSVATEGHYLFIKGHTFIPDETLPDYLIDTSLYVTRNPFNPLSWVNIKKYKLDADSGDTWLTYADTSGQERAVLRDTYWSYVLGAMTVVKEIDYYGQQLGDTSLWGSFIETDHIAAGFGFIFRYKEADHWPSYIISGSVINGDTSGTITSLEQVSKAVPKAFTLKQNYPNPFNPLTTIEFELARKEQIELGVFNMLGQKVAILALGEYPPGTYKFEFDSSYLSSGEYIYYLKSKSQTLTGRMILIK